MASLVFAGLWLVLFGVLVYKSRFLPRFLGAQLFLSAAAWLVVCFGRFLTPQFGDAIDMVTMPI